IHAGLHGADRVNFGDFNDHAFLAQGRGRAFTHIAVTDNQRFFTAHQVVSTTLDRVVQGMTATVFVVVFGFGNGIVYVNSRNFQLTFFQHFQQTVYTGGGFFRNTVNAVQHGRIFGVNHFGQVAAVV